MPEFKLVAEVLRPKAAKKCARVVIKLRGKLLEPSTVANDHEGLTREQRREGLASLASMCAACEKECRFAGKGAVPAFKRPA